MFESADELLATVAETCAARDAADRAVALALADTVAAGAFSAAGLSHGGAWLRAYTESAPQEAGRLISLGRLLARHPRTRAAVETGSLSPARAGVGCRGHRRTPRPLPGSRGRPARTGRHSGPCR